MRPISNAARVFLVILLAVIVIFIVLVTYSLIAHPDENRLRSNPLIVHESIATFIVNEVTCPDREKVEIVSTDSDGAITAIGGDVIDIFNVNVSADIMSVDVFEKSFSEASQGRLKLDPLIFTKEDDVYRFSDKNIRLFIWKNRNTRMTEGRVWFHDKNISYSFEIGTDADRKATSIIYDIINLNSDENFIDFLIKSN